VALYDVYPQKITECDRQIEASLQRIFPPHFGEGRTISRGYLHSCPIM
jgi:hypothetical protein